MTFLEKGVDFRADEPSFGEVLASPKKFVRTTTAAERSKRIYRRKRRGATISHSIADTLANASAAANAATGGKWVRGVSLRLLRQKLRSVAVNKGSTTGRRLDFIKPFEKLKTEKRSVGCLDVARLVRSGSGGKARLSLEELVVLAQLLGSSKDQEAMQSASKLTADALPLLRLAALQNFLEVRILG